MACSWYAGAFDGGGKGERTWPPSREGTTLEQLLLMLRRRWHLIVACVVLVAGAAIAFSLLQRDEYTASASLLFSNTQFDQELFGSNFTVECRRSHPRGGHEHRPRLAADGRIANCRRPASARPSWSGRRSACPVAVRRMSRRSAPRIQIRSAPLKSRTRTSSSTSSSARRPTGRRSPAPRASSRRSSPPCRPLSATGSVGQSLQNRADQLGVLAALQTGNAEVVQPASVPTSPSSPQDQAERYPRRTARAAARPRACVLGRAPRSARARRLRARGGLRRAGARSRAREPVLLERPGRSRFPPSRPRRSRSFAPGFDTSMSTATFDRCSSRRRLPARARPLWR